MSRRGRAWARSVLLRGGRLPEEVDAVGRCHEPVLRGGRRLRVVRRAPRVGEVALVRVGDRLLAHRLLADDGEEVLTRGDRPGQRLERHRRSAVVGVAEPARWPADLGLVGPVGRVLARGSTLLSSRAVFPRARSVYRAVTAWRPAARRLELVVETRERPGLLADLARLGVLPDSVAPEDFAAEYLAGTGRVIGVRRSSGRLVGALVLHPPPGTPTVTIAVEAGLRGRGLGARLLHAGLEEARRGGARQVYADIARANWPSRALFRRAGFRLATPGVRAAPGEATVEDRFVWEGPEGL